MFMKDFTKAFPAASVWVCPGQWSWPINLPLGFRIDGVLTKVGAPCCYDQYVVDPDAS